jgi:hypothetical protein
VAIDALQVLQQGRATKARIVPMSPRPFQPLFAMWLRCPMGGPAACRGFSDFSGKTGKRLIARETFASFCFHMA